MTNLRRCAFLFMLAGLVFVMPVRAGEIDEPDTKVLESDSELMQEIDRHKEDSYFQDIVISPDRKKVEVDGEKQSFSEAFDLTEKKTDQILSSDKKTMDWLSDQEYETEEKKDGEILVTAPYQSKRIIVKGMLKEDFGAEFIYRDKEFSETVLQFDTAQKAREVCEKLNRLYGEDKAMPDLIVSSEKVSQASSMSGCLSWGGSYMGFNKIKSTVPASCSKQKVTVAIIDGGYNKSSPLVRGRKISRHSKAFWGNSSNLWDVYGHGCHVTGIISDLTPSNVELMILKVSDYEGNAPLLYLKKAISYARRHGADIINLSMGIQLRPWQKTHYLDSVIDQCYNNGCPVVVAAGNDNVNVKNTYPANYSRVITVGALNTLHSLAAYSNYGNKIDFVAPGSDIESSDLRGSADNLICSGTSMAAPHITAACAYIKMMKPRLSAYGVFRELKAYSKDLGKAGKDNSYGWGVPKISAIYKKGIRNAAYVTVHPGRVKIRSVRNEGKGIRVTWKKNIYTSKYVLYRKTGGGSFRRIRVIDGANVTSFIDRKVKQGKTYRYRVRTYKLGYYGKVSNYRTVMRLGSLKVGARKKKAGSIRVAWKKKKGSGQYQVQYSLTKTFRKRRTFTLSSGKNKKIIKNLKRGRTYYIRVRSRNKKGSVVSYGAWSGVRKVVLK